MLLSPPMPKMIAPCFFIGLYPVGRAPLKSVARVPDWALPPRISHWFAPPSITAVVNRKLRREANPRCLFREKWQVAGAHRG